MNKASIITLACLGMSLTDASFASRGLTLDEQMKGKQSIQQPIAALELEQLRSQMGLTRGQLNTMQQNLAGVQEQLTVERQVAATNQAAKEQLTGQVTYLRDQLAGTQRQLGETQASLLLAQQQKADADQQKNALSDQVDELTARVTNLTAALAIKEVELSNYIRSTRENMMILRADLIHSNSAPSPEMLENHRNTLRDLVQRHQEALEAVRLDAVQRTAEAVAEVQGRLDVALVEKTDALRLPETASANQQQVQGQLEVSLRQIEILQAERTALLKELETMRSLSLKSPAVFARNDENAPQAVVSKSKVRRLSIKSSPLRQVDANAPMAVSRDLSSSFNEPDRGMIEVSLEDDLEPAHFDDSMRRGYELSNLHYFLGMAGSYCFISMHEGASEDLLHYLKSAKDYPLKAVSHQSTPAFPVFWANILTSYKIIKLSEHTKGD